MAVSPSKFNNFVHNLAIAGVNCNTGVWKVMLTNTAPVATNSAYSDISGNEVASGTNGYTTAGGTVPSPTSTNSSGTETVACSGGITWTSGPNNLGPFRYAVLYDSTSGKLCCWWDYGSSITLIGANGDQFVWTPSANTLFTLA
jgi:hypothetical protein